MPSIDPRDAAYGTPILYVIAPGMIAPRSVAFKPAAMAARGISSLEYVLNLFWKMVLKLRADTKALSTAVL